MEKQVHIKNAGSLIIAGPCSAESPEQLLETANALKLCGSVDYFRAGLWKPRTSPDSFQGVGSEGLKWLRMVKEETGMKVATEVACESHVQEALRYDIDLLWIGARTVTNPFIVQQIADSLRGVEIPVLVKNPLNPDPDLWYGAISRFLKAGINEVGAVHRGFSVWGRSVYRNPPIWELPLSLMERLPGILIICDPSHIAGRRSLVPLVAGRAMAEGFGGLMVEVHPEPEKAWSDAEQQITPRSFIDMIRELDLPGNHDRISDGPSIDELSSEIDMVDELLVHTIASRIELFRHIARLRRPGRSGSETRTDMADEYKRVHGLAAEDGLRPDFIHRLFAEIFRESGRVCSSGSGFMDK